MVLQAIRFNAAIPVELQLTDFSCSVGATFWCLQSLGQTITQRALQDIMVPALVSPDLGLLDSSGATIASLLRDRFGLQARNVNPVSFEDVADRAGKQPLLMGGRRWHAGVGHWVAVRGFDGQRIVLANPGGTGPNFGQQALDRNDFSERGSFSAVFIDIVAGGRQFRIANTDGQGARLRSDPSVNGQAVRGLREGAIVTGGDHAWRKVTTTDGAQGWIANEYLTKSDAQFSVSNTDGGGANLRSAPAADANPPLKLLPEGTRVTGEEHAWRQVTDTDGTVGWVADELLVGA